MGRNFIADAKLLTRVVLNIGNEQFPHHISEGIVDSHGRQFTLRMFRYRKRFAPPLREFLRIKIPTERPGKVVYPFGGGDLISALLAFPDSPELTTISLEQAGDPSRIHYISQERLSQSLRSMNMQMGGMLSVGSNTSKNLSNSQRNDLPVQIIATLIGLAAHGYEPVAMYYFLLDADGDIHYLNEAEIIELDKKKAQSLRLSWRRPNFSPAFRNVEIHYRRMNRIRTKAAPVQIYRHIAASLQNGRLFKNTPLLKHLEAKGLVTGLVKGASYLLWQDGYSIFRDYMLAHMPFILSDSTGIPLEYAEAAGFRIDTFGKFSGSFLRANETHNNAFRQLWNRNPYTEMPSRFGYLDNAGHAHLMISIREDRNYKAPAF